MLCCGLQSLGWGLFHKLHRLALHVPAQRSNLSSLSDQSKPFKQSTVFYNWDQYTKLCLYAFGLFFCFVLQLGGFGFLTFQEKTYKDALKVVNYLGSQNSIRSGSLEHSVPGAAAAITVQSFYAALFSNALFRCSLPEAFSFPPPQGSALAISKLQWILLLCCCPVLLLSFPETLWFSNPPALGKVCIPLPQALYITNGYTSPQTHLCLPSTYIQKRPNFYFQSSVLFYHVDRCALTLDSCMHIITFLLLHFLIEANWSCCFN